MGRASWRDRLAAHVDRRRPGAGARARSRAAPWSHRPRSCCRPALRSGKPVVDGLPGIVDRPLAIVPGQLGQRRRSRPPVVTAVRWYSCVASCALVGHDAAPTCRSSPTGPPAGRRGRPRERRRHRHRHAAPARRHRRRAADPGLGAGHLRAGPGRRDRWARSRPVIAGHGAPSTVALTWFACRDAAGRHLHRRRRAGADAPDRRGRARPAPARARRHPQRGRLARHVVGADRAGARPQRVRAGRARARSPPASAPRRASRCEASLDRGRASSPASAVVVRGRITVSGDVPRPDRVTVVRGGRAQPRRRRCRRRIRPDLRARAVGARHRDGATSAGRGDALVLDAGEVRVVPRIDRALHRPPRPLRHGARPARDRSRAAARARLAVPAAARGPHAEGPRRRPHLPRRRAAGRARRAATPRTAGRAGCRGWRATACSSCPAPARRSRRRRPAGSAPPSAASPEDAPGPDR